MATVNENPSAAGDAPANTQTTYSMAVGDTFNGILDEKFDEDWISIELEKGKDLPDPTFPGAAKDGDEAEDTILKLYDSQGNLVAMNDDIDTAKRIYDSELTVSITFTGHLLPQRRQLHQQPDPGQLRRLRAHGQRDGHGDTTIRGTGAGDRLTGTNSGDSIYGLGGNDTLSTGAAVTTNWTAAPATTP